jgi:hypothetical protein
MARGKLECPTGCLALSARWLWPRALCSEPDGFHLGRLLTSPIQPCILHPKVIYWLPVERCRLRLQIQFHHGGSVRPELTLDGRSRAER